MYYHRYRVVIHFLASSCSLEYDAATNRFSDMPDVTVEVPGFGDTSSVEALDTLGLIRYLADFVDYFVDRGYQRGRSIRAAPYDWRLAAGRFTINTREVPVCDSALTPSL